MKLLLSYGFGFILLFFSSSGAYSQKVIYPSSAAKITNGAIYSYILTGLSTASEASSLVAIFKARPGITDASVDLPNHKLTVYVPGNTLESDILEVIKYAGKVILTDPDEIVKYYH